MSITIRRRPYIVGVMGGADAPAPLLEEAFLLGDGIARRGHVLLTGGGPGIMRAASEGAWRAGGLVIAVLPNDRLWPLDGYPNEYVDIPIYTGLSDARNVINAKTPHLIVILPGGAGTLSELALALKAGTPVVTLRRDPPEFAPPGACVRAETVAEVLAVMDDRLPPLGAVLTDGF
ncbi:MAG TPA: LOG family protein [Syntrophales bacterium]|nr:LOG family protein [Syntrophales bacterium]HOM07279.1 LOG family protein [Syntrophales bacterium]HOO00152.1 LOG family protein [Syntrophales bacterium]HPC01339.1 LOG family protein [Syntrophales bacterium]HPQ06876.1 LOG family protein [Syntrophales bacterium]